MWRRLKFIHMWINFKFLHITKVEKSEISCNMCTINGILLHFKLFCCKICVFLAIYAVLSQNWFVAIHALSMEKILAKNSVRGEKMTNIRYVLDPSMILLRPDVNLLLRPDVPEHDSGGRLLVPGKEEAASSQKVSYLST